MLLIIIYLLGIIGALLHIYFDVHERTLRRICGIILLYSLVASGAVGVWEFAGHIFFADTVARYLGWPIGSPFQFEVGIADLAVGIISLLCIWLRGNFWLAAIIVGAIFDWGSAVGALRQSSYHLSILLLDVIPPIINISAFLIYRTARQIVRK